MDFKVGVMWTVMIISLGLAYEKIWRERKCRKRILKYVEEKGGILETIELKSEREEVYAVTYLKNGKVQKFLVKFSFLYDMTFL